MKQLSIVIVNYNVQFFLEQCLQSVERAIETIDAEVWVVDNASVDGSMEMVAQKFPWVKTILNKDNVGFSKANNQAIRKSNSKYVLLLNPDTVVEENTFTEVLNFMEAHPDAGALGIKMIDGKGNYLPESKRGLPTPMVAFYKLFGLTGLFPKSKRFAHYYMGHLSENENHPVEILAGAFMFMRKEALDKAGLLDEDFFMYGEDIDLSYRITKAGYQNYYFADSSIIHYKGESTKKGSLNYVYVFYNAMVIFARKHFSQSYARFFDVFIKLAIVFRAALSALKRFVFALSLPAFDAGLLFGGLYYIKEYWEHNHRFIEGGEYPPELLYINFPIYIGLWLSGLLLAGGYKKPTKIGNILKGVALGTLLVLVTHALIDNSLRFSRAIILLGGMFALLSIPFARWLLQQVFGFKLLQQADKEKRLGIVGNLEEVQRVENLVKQSSKNVDYITYIAPGDEANQHENYLGSLINLPDLCRVFQLDEIVFCAKDVESERIFESMVALNPQNVEIKIAPSQSEFVIGSNSIDHQGNWYGIQFNDLSKPQNKRKKRLFDILSSVTLIILSPVLFWFTKIPLASSAWDVMTGSKTWIGYDVHASTTHLPQVKQGVLFTTAQLNQQLLDEKTVNHLNQLYAKEYSFRADAVFLVQNLFK